MPCSFFLGGAALFSCYLCKLQVLPSVCSPPGLLMEDEGCILHTTLQRHICEHKGGTQWAVVIAPATSAATRVCWEQLLTCGIFQADIYQMNRHPLGFQSRWVPSGPPPPACPFLQEEGGEKRNCGGEENGWLECQGHSSPSFSSSLLSPILFLLELREEQQQQMLSHLQATTSRIFATSRAPRTPGNLANRV